MCPDSLGRNHPCQTQLVDKNDASSCWLIVQWLCQEKYLCHLSLLLAFAWLSFSGLGFA